MSANISKLHRLTVLIYHNVSARTPLYEAASHFEDYPSVSDQRIECAVFGLTQRPSS